MTLLTSFKIKFLREQLALTKDVPGDIIEAGVYKGGSLLIIAKDSADWNKRTIGYDTFTGLPELGDKDNQKAHHKGDFADTSMQGVRGMLAGFDGVQLVEGYYPDTANHGPVSFAHLDMDLYQPTLVALQFLYPLMNPDGIIVLDDYIFDNCPGIEQAVKEVSELYDIVATAQWQCALKVKAIR